MWKFYLYVFHSNSNDVIFRVLYPNCVNRRIQCCSFWTDLLSRIKILWGVTNLIESKLLSTLQNSEHFINNHRTLSLFHCFNFFMMLAVINLPLVISKFGNPVLSVHCCHSKNNQGTGNWLWLFSDAKNREQKHFDSGLGPIVRFSSLVFKRKRDTPDRQQRFTENLNDNTTINQVDQL